ncbi:MAG: acyltransferase family protein [Clostridia bacterium]|nr:acyltransferase family protein [Clostridia bacterium]
MDKKDRIPYFDLCKGILIILVVFGHVIPETSPMHIWLYSWHMPAFFIVSGMLLSQTSFGIRPLLGTQGVFWGRMRKLMFPYVVYSALLLLARWAGHGFSSEVLRWQLIDLFSLCGIGATWFLPCLFIAQMLYHIVERISSLPKNRFFRCTVKYLMCCLLFLLTVLCERRTSVFLVLFRSFAAVFFFGIGLLLQPVIQKMQAKSTPSVCLCTAVCTLFSLLLYIETGKNDASMNVLRYSNPFLFIMNGVLGTTSVLLLAIVLERLCPKTLLRPVLFFGKETLVILGTHQLLMLLLQIPVSDLLLMNILYCAIILIIEIPIVFLIRQIRSLFQKRKANGN